MMEDVERRYGNAVDCQVAVGQVLKGSGGTKGRKLGSTQIDSGDRLRRFNLYKHKFNNQVNNGRFIAMFRF